MKISNRSVATITVGCVFMGLLSCAESAAEDSQVEDGNEGIVTLYSVDDILHAWSFSLGEAGRVCLDGCIYNRNTQLAYGKFGAQLVAGIEGRSKARILDIGDLRVRGQLTSVYHELTRDGSVVIAGNVMSDDPQDVMTLSGDRRFDLVPGHPMAKVVAEIGHVYLIRLDEGGVDTNPIFVALRILDHVPRRYVTFRWRLL